MRIGIAVTTTNTRPKTFALWKKQVARHTRPIHDGEAVVEFIYHIQPFYPKKHRSIAEVKNICLRELMEQDCDYLYLFDDDCFPVHPQWWVPFIEAHLRTGQHHFCYLKDDTEVWGNRGRRLLKTENGVAIFHNLQGCCLFMTRKAVETVGGMDENFQPWGYEHDNYSHRIFMSGLNTMGMALSVPGIEEYIYSLDVQGAYPFASQLGSEYNPKYGKVRSAARMIDIKLAMNNLTVDGDSNNKKELSNPTPVIKIESAAAQKIKDYYTEQYNLINKGLNLYIPL